MIDIWAPDAYKYKPEDAASEKAKICYEQEWESNMVEAHHVHNRFWAQSKMYRLPSVNAVKLFEDNYFDFVYIDAAHDYESVKADIREWLPKVKPGGYICGHDYGGEYTGVKKAVDEMFGGRVYEDSDFTWFVRI
jgi:hypothetical protein